MFTEGRSVPGPPPFPPDVQLHPCFPGNEPLIPSPAQALFPPKPEHVGFRRLQPKGYVPLPTFSSPSGPTEWLAAPRTRPAVSGKLGHARVTVLLTMKISEMQISLFGL